MPLYNGPAVSITIGDTTYNVPKTLLCHHSSYFKAMFDGKFKEGEEQSIKLDELEEVVSNRSFQLLLQWLYLGRITLGEESPADGISALTKFARLADMVGFTNVESHIEKSIRMVILANPPPDGRCKARSEANIYHITPGHICAAACLPTGHAVRLLLSKAAVNTYLHSEDFKFSNEIREIPGVAADLLEELRKALKSTRFDVCMAYYKDPFSGEELSLRP